MKHLFRFKELKHLKSSKYGSKKIRLSKIDIENICNFIGVDSNVKYLSSGSFGDAYSIGDKVLKLTTDKREAQTAWNAIGLNNPGIVKYWGVWQYPKGGDMLYVILMDKVIPLIDYLEKSNLKKYSVSSYIDLCEEICDIIFDNWKDLTYQKLIDELSYNIHSGLPKKLTVEIFNMYENIKSYNILDIHIYNIGVKDGKILLYDITPIRLRLVLLLNYKQVVVHPLRIEVIRTRRRFYH